MGDLHGDGRAEIVSQVWWFLSGASYQAGALVVTRWPAPAPASSEVIPLTSDRDALAIASISGGGLAELLLAGYGSLGLLAARGDGGFLPEVRWSAPIVPGRSARPAAGDLDGDLHADVVVPAGDHVVVFRGTCPGQ